MAHAGTCEVHADHRPRVSDVDVHHVWPTGMGGPDVPANRVDVCPTGHRNVHTLLRAWLRAGGPPPWPVRQAFHPVERDLAELGYRRVQARSMGA